MVFVYEIIAGLFMFMFGIVIAIIWNKEFRQYETRFEMFMAIALGLMWFYILIMGIIIMTGNIEIAMDTVYNILNMEI